LPRWVLALLRLLHGPRAQRMRRRQRILEYFGIFAVLYFHFT
jgi:hypothetical protein